MNEKTIIAKTVIIKLYESGMTQTSIAKLFFKELDCSHWFIARQKIGKILKANGVCLNSRSENGRRAGETRRKNIKEASCQEAIG
jgi:hypothetical protein